MIKEVFILEFVDYKCLENLLIEGTNLIATEQSTKLSTPGVIMDLDKKRDKINIRFFNKIWKVPVQYDTNDSANITDYTKFNKSLTNFAYYSKNHSTEIESRFVTLCNKMNDDPKYTGIDNIEKYEDLKKLTIKDVSIQYYPKYNDKIFIVLRGNIDLDPEHGYSIAFVNGKWIPYIGQYSDFWPNEDYKGLMK